MTDTVEVPVAALAQARDLLAFCCDICRVPFICARFVELYLLWHVPAGPLERWPCHGYFLPGCKFQGGHAVPQSSQKIDFLYFVARDCWKRSLEGR